MFLQEENVDKVNSAASAPGDATEQAEEAKESREEQQARREASREGAMGDHARARGARQAEADAEPRGGPAQS